MVRSERLSVGEAGVMLDRPASDRGSPAVVLAPGAGSDAASPFLAAVARGLAQRAHPVVRFDFAYRLAGRRRPDPPARLRAQWLEVVAAARARLGANRPLVVGGRSMGGRIASILVAEGLDVTGLCLLGYPLHPVGQPQRLRTEHWPRIRVPTLFVQGDRDALAPLDTLERERAARLVNAPSKLHVVRGADHSFTTRKSDRAPSHVHAEVVAVVAGWLSGLPPAANIGT